MRLQTAQRLFLCFSTLVILIGVRELDDDINNEQQVREIELIEAEVQEAPCEIIELKETIVYEAPTPEPTVGRYAAIAESISPEERSLTALVVYHESRGESEDGQRAVAEVIFNRVLSDRFPNDIESVIYQEGQFGCASYLTTAAIREPGALATAFNVVEEVLYEEEYALPAHYYFFSTGKPKAADYIQIEHHYFR